MTTPVPIRVLHPITRLVVGGAQENTIITADQLRRDPAYNTRFVADIASGPDTGAEGELQSEVRARGIPLTLIPGLRNPIRPPDDGRALFALYTLIKRNQYDIVHTHSTKAGLIGRMAAKLAGVPVIIHTVHGWGFNERMSLAQQRILVPMERMVARWTDRMIAVTPLDIEKGLLLGIGRPEQYTTIRSGIELDRFGCVGHVAADMRRSLGIAPDAPVVGTVTRLSPQKAPLDFIRAARVIADQIPAARFVVVGDGPLRAEVEDLIGSLGLEECVTLTGLRRDVPELMTAFDVFVLTSLWEGLPRVLPQAMTTGLPVVATAADGTAEIVEHGTNGFLVHKGESAELANHVVYLLNHPQHARAMGQQGKQRAQRWGAHEMVQQIVDVYDDVLRAKRVT